MLKLKVYLTQYSNSKNLRNKHSLLDMDDNLREIKAEQEKNKGNEAFRSGFFEEALVYYTRSIEYLPAAAYYNNRALTCNLKFLIL